MITGSEKAKENAGALWILALNNNNKVAIGKEKGIKPLIEPLTTGSELAKENAAGALLNMAMNIDNQKTIIKEGGRESLANLTSSGTEAAKKNAEEVNY